MAIKDGVHYEHANHFKRLYFYIIKVMSFQN